MAKGRPKQAVVLPEEDRQQLTSVARSRSLPHALVVRARLVRMASEGLPSFAIADKLGLSQQTVCLWRRRYLQHGIQELHDELKPGRPRSISDEAVSLVRKTLQTKPKDGTHWTIRTIAGETRLSRPTVHRI
jgi:putative transposase